MTDDAKAHIWSAMLSLQEGPVSDLLVARVSSEAHMILEVFGPWGALDAVAQRGQLLSACVMLADRPALEEAMRVARQSDTLTRCEARLSDARWIAWRVWRLPGLESLGVVGQDVTALRLAQQALALARQELASAREEVARAREEAVQDAQRRSAFLGNISHALRAPMSGIVGMTQRLLETPLDHRQQSYMATIQNNAQTTLALVNDLLDLSRIEAQLYTIEPLDFSLRVFLEDVAHAIAPQAQRKGVTLTWSVDRALPDVLSADPLRLRQIMLNLLTNAIKHADAGEVFLRATLAGVVGTQQLVSLEVEDRGVGIAPEALSELFEPLGGGAEAGSMHQGEGLGLALSSQLARMMGGDLRAESTLGKGSVFSLLLLTPRPEQMPAESHPLGARALVVMDGTDAPRVLSALSTSCGVATAMASPASQALRDAALELPSGPLLVFIPTGAISPALIKAARSLRPGRVSVIALHALEKPDEALRRLVDGVLSLPLRRAALLHELVRCQLRRQDLATEDAEVITVALPALALDAASSPTLDDVFWDALMSGAGPEGHDEEGKVLLVEDDRTTRRVLEAYLRKLGYHYDVAADGEQALALYQPAQHRVILLDCYMPGVDGYEVARQLRKRADAGATVPIIALTAYATPDDRERALRAGIDDYIAKPVSFEHLQQLVVWWWRRAQLAPASTSESLSEPEQLSSELAMDQLLGWAPDALSEQDLAGVSSAARSLDEEGEPEFRWSQALSALGTSASSHYGISLSALDSTQVSEVEEQPSPWTVALVVDPLDRVHLGRLMRDCGDDTFVQDLLEHFSDQLQEHMLALRAWWHQEQGSEAGALMQLQSLKSACMMLGLRRMVALCVIMETAMHAGQATPLLGMEWLTVIGRVATQDLTRAQRWVAMTQP